MIKFTEPYISGLEEKFIQEVFEKRNFAGDGQFSEKLSSFFKEKFSLDYSLITPSCTHSLEMAAILADIKEGDEVILPSFTFTSTANAFVLRGARLKYVDIRKDTLNINETLIESAITKKTKAIIPVHYAGVSCEMDQIMEIANAKDIFVIEDAAQGIDAKYKGQYLGGIGHLGAISFQQTKNIHCGEGGALFCSNEELFKRAEVIREKGTNRKHFLRGEVDKYSWVDIGSSYLPTELANAFLYGQFAKYKDVTKRRLEIWNKYFSELSDLSDQERVILPGVPSHCEHNAHLFYLRVSTSKEASRMVSYFKENGIQGTTHYVPLHLSSFGKKVGEFVGEDKFTSSESSQMVRLPLHMNLSDKDVSKVIEVIKNFFKS